MYWSNLYWSRLSEPWYAVVIDVSTTASMQYAYSIPSYNCTIRLYGESYIETCLHFAINSFSMKSTAPSLKKQ